MRSFAHFEGKADARIPTLRARDALLKNVRAGCYRGGRQVAERLPTFAAHNDNNKATAARIVAEIESDATALLSETTVDLKIRQLSISISQMALLAKVLGITFDYFQAIIKINGEKDLLRYLALSSARCEQVFSATQKADGAHGDAAALIRSIEALCQLIGCFDTVAK